MTVDEVKRAIRCSGIAGTSHFRTGLLAGLRTGEIFGLRRNRVSENTADIQERVYRGKVDTPKTQKSIRVVAFSPSVREDLGAWLKASPKCVEGQLGPNNPEKRRT